MATYKTLELTVVSARDLKKANLIGKMNVYASVSLFGDSGYPYNNVKQKIPVHRDGGSSPRWNYTVAFTVDEAKLANLKVVFDLEHKRTLCRDKKVRKAVVWVNNLLRKKGQTTDSSFSYKVRTPSGKDQGQLDFSFKLSATASPDLACVGSSFS